MNPSSPLSNNHQSSPGAAHLTVVETIYHVLDGGQPTVTEHRRSYQLLSQDSPLGPRRLTVGPEWQKLEQGWLSRLSVLHIENLEGTHFRVNPTPAELAQIEQLVVEVGFLASELTPDQVMPCWEIKPGRAFRGSPSPGKDIYLRCRNGSALCSLTLFPE